MEGFNLPPLEAMASGCPAVCTKTGRPLEIIENGVNGYLVEAGKAQNFAEALSEILSLPQLAWTEMSRRAVASVAHPTWTESSDLFEAALKKAVEREIG
jgi:glycosyltransferase involved in cell wall biosynthesis